MAGVRVHAGKINGLHRALRIRRSRVRLRSTNDLAWLAAGAAVYAVALAFPLILRQVTAVAYGCAVLGTILLLFGLRLRWNGSRPVR